MLSQRLTLEDCFVCCVCGGRYSGYRLKMGSLTIRDATDLTLEKMRVSVSEAVYVCLCVLNSAGGTEKSLL